MRMTTFLTGLLTAMAMMAGGCDQADAEGGGAPDGKITVVCTTTMIADLARQIAGDKATVVGIMKPGEDPHVYEVRPRDAQAIASGDVVLLNGLHLEATLSHIIDNNARKDATVARLAESPSISPLGKQDDGGAAASGGAPDPHCWFDVNYFKVYAQAAGDALAAADPTNADHYRQRTAAYVKQLDELDAWVRQQIAAIPRDRRVLITSHDAFAYYGRAYEINVFAVIGISTEQQPRPQDIAQLEATVRDQGVKALFIETSVSNTLNDMVRKVAAATGAKIGGTLYSDSLGPEDSPAATYIDMVRHNTTTIVQALQ